MTQKDLDAIRAWYEQFQMSNKVIHSRYTNGAGVLVHGVTITYPATPEEWIKNDVKIETPDNYGQPV